MSILPNRMLTCLGWHTADDAARSGADCMTLAVSPASAVVPLVASGLPLASSIKFWSVAHLPAEAETESAGVVTGKKVTIRSWGRDAKARVTSRGADRDREDFLSGLTARSGEEDDEDEEEEEEASSSSGSD